ncbi:uncharacterized protein LOC134826043 [Bolinopsis microptera]|uniref:uncharacterized protein LOC134826043 n=1 Tax=Bolinopsis microptera TaxID=2820187 RepID=UPI003079E676
MGCGASSTANSPTIDPNDERENEETPDLSVLIEIHDALSIEDTASIQRILFPLSREKLIELDKSYRKKYGISFADLPVLKTDPIWGMFFSENLAKQQLQRFLNQGTGDMLLLVDIVLSLQDGLDLLKVFNEEIVRTLDSKFETEKDVLNLIKCCVPDRPQMVRLSDDREVEIAHPAVYFATRLHDHLSDSDVSDMLYIILMRREVDLGEIAYNYKTKFSESLWDHFSESYPHLQLLDLSPVKRPSDNCSHNYELEIVQSEVILDNSSTTATENGAVEVPTNDVSFESDESPKALVLEDSPPEHSLALDSSSGPISEPSPLVTPAPPPNSLPAHDPLVHLTPVLVAENKLTEVPTANVTVDVINCKPSNSDVIEDFDEVAECEQVVEHEEVAEFEEVAELQEVKEIEQLPEEMQSTATNSKMVISFEDHLKILYDVLSEITPNVENISLALVDVVSHGHHDIVHHYSDTYCQDLLKSLQEKLPEDAFKAAQYLLLRYLKASALLLNEAITENDHSTVDQILMVLLCSSTKQVRDIVKEFPISTSERRSLSEVLTENLLGEFQRFIAALLKGDRDEDSTTNETVAKSDACRLHKATDFKWDGEDNVFNEVFIKRNMKQLKLTFTLFSEESGQDITELILQEFTFHLQKALLNLVYTANNGLTTFLAKFVFESKSKSHFSSVLLWIVSARYDVDLKEIASEYNIKYGSPLTDLIDGANLSEDCRTLFIILCQSLR